MLYKTTKEFLIQFGLKDLAELPSLKEFEEIRRMAFSDERRAATAAAAPSPRGDPRRPSRRSAAVMPEERLQKILSQAGVASRRQAEKIIVEGRVTVNGTVVTELGSKADLERDHIKVDGHLLRPPKRLAYIVLNKPNNTVTTVSDPEGRPTVMELLRGVKERVYPVGRLDYHSEGLLLLTNDGEIANAITSAATHLTKTYVVKVTGRLTTDQEEQFRRGVPILGQTHHAGRLEADPRRRKSLVRSQAHRGPEPADPPDVQALRLSGRKAPQGTHRPDRDRAVEAGPVPLSV